MSSTGPHSKGVLCVVPTADGKERYVLLDDWVPPADPAPPDEAAAELVRRYLAAFGPATPADFARWSGLGAPAARAAWDSVAAELAEVADGGWVLQADAERVAQDAGQPVPLRLLGGFDTLVLGYADRSLLVPADRAADVNAGGGLIRPTVLSDGEVVGTWSVRAGVDEFRRLSAEERAGLDSELADVAALPRRRRPLYAPERCLINCRGCERSSSGSPRPGFGSTTRRWARSARGSACSWAWPRGTRRRLR